MSPGYLHPGRTFTDGHSFRLVLKMSGRDAFGNPIVPVLWYRVRGGKDRREFCLTVATFAAWALREAKEAEVEELERRERDA